MRKSTPVGRWTPLLILGAIVAAFSPAKAADTKQSATAVAPGIDILLGRFDPGSQPDSNTILLRAPGGLIVVDTGRHSRHHEAILGYASQAAQPIVAIVNTHWHLDHIGGNARLREAHPGATVHASSGLDGALTGFLARYRASLGEQLIAAQTKNDAEAARRLETEIALIDGAARLKPTHVVRESGPVDVGGRKLRLELAAHAATAGDVWFLEESTRTLVAGDLVTLPVPFLDTACPSGWAAALDRLAEQDFARLIPGHGPVMDRAAFDAYHRGFDNLRACSATDSAKPVCIDGWIRDLGAQLREGDMGYVRAALDYYIDQSLRAAPAQTAALCGKS